MHTLTPKNHSIVPGKPPTTYPLRTAQRNLNKILLGDGDDTDSLNDCSKSSASTTKSSMLDLHAMLENSRTMVTNHGQDFASIVLKKEPSTMNGDCSDALRNDVKLNQYNPFTSYFTHNQTDQISDQSHHHHHQQHLQQATHSACTNVVDAHSYGDHNDPMGTNNNTKGVRNALMSEIGSLSPLNQMIHQQDAVGMYCVFFFLAYSIFTS